MKHTKGRAKAFLNIVQTDNLVICSTFMYTRLGSCKIEESEANANLIAEAFNVTNECGLTPRQLLDAYYVLASELKEFKGLYNETE